MRNTIASHEAVTDGGTRLRILVVDDNRDNADGCTALLELAGHEVRAVYDPREAVDIAASFCPQVLLLDIGMPKLNGYELAERIRATPWGQKITLIAITGWGQKKDKRRAYATGFDHHLTKPFEMSDLIRVLESVGRTDSRS